MANLDFSEFDSLFENIKENTAAIPNPVVQANPMETEISNVVVSANSVDSVMLQSAQAKMQQISVEMNNLFVERDKLINLMLLAITTGTNLLMLGPPGTARVDIIA